MNMTAGKNLVGTFHQPEAVIADSDFLRTLPEREIGAGIAEIIKHGVLADKTYFEELERDMEKGARPRDGGRSGRTILRD